MAFWDIMKSDMWEISHMESWIMDCHEEWNDEKDDICCYDKDYGFSSLSNIQTQNNKKKFDKTKYNLVELSFLTSPIYEWNLIWNISPPYQATNIKSYDYISLIWIIKSNT